MRSDLSFEFCNSTLKSQALPLQLRILYSVLYHVISPRSGLDDKVTHLDMALLDSILQGRVLNVGYTILHHMLNSVGIAKRSLPFGNIITRILKHFRVPIIKATFFSSKELRDEAIANL